MFRKQLSRNFFSSILYHITPFPKCNLRFVIEKYNIFFFFPPELSELNRREGGEKRKRERDKLICPAISQEKNLVEKFS